ncbi:photosystem II reaction center PsbP family protein [Desulfovibrio sp. OttesenSCG-928-G15]|nr:photosystem II reaction center PsbP family protein [Desulfovibrio sp. OttesenSCG-928-G15]
MRRCILFCIMVVGLVIGAGHAVADIKTFPGFSIDLPPGWVYEQEGITLAFFPPDKSVNLQVTVEPIINLYTEGITVKELAEEYARELGGTQPVMEQGDPNFFSFSYTSPIGLPSEASVVVSRRRFYLITISGSHAEFARMVESVLFSIFNE